MAFRPTPGWSPFAGPDPGLPDFAPAAQQTAAQPTNPGGLQSTVNPLTGLTGAPNATTPYNQTQQYQTTPGSGTVASQVGALSQPSYEVQQQSQLESQLGSQQAAQQQGFKTANMTEAARLQAAAEQRRLGYLSQIGGQAPPQVQGGGGPTGDETAARGAAFARAKEQAGSTAAASMKALQDVMAGRGLTGGSTESQGMAGILSGAAGGVNEFTRDQLMQDLNRSAQLADRNYQGAITQRGQDRALLPSLLGLITSSGGGVY